MYLFDINICSFANAVYISANAHIAVDDKF